MSDLNFTLHILVSTVATAAAYALLMTVLKKEVSRVWLKREALIAWTGATVSLVIGWSYLLMADAPTLVASGAFLALGLVSALTLTLLISFKAGQDPVCPDHLVPTVKYISIFTFMFLCAHLLLEFAGFSSM